MTTNQTDTHVVSSGVLELSEAVWCLAGLHLVPTSNDHHRCSRCQREAHCGIADDWHAETCEVGRLLRVAKGLSTSERSTAAEESAFVREGSGPAGGQAPASHLEPWYWNEASGNANLFDANGGLLLSVSLSLSPGAGRLIARRVVAAVNASVGISTEQLEVLSDPQLLQAVIREAVRQSLTGGL